MEIRCVASKFHAWVIFEEIMRLTFSEDAIPSERKNSRQQKCRAHIFSDFLSKRMHHVEDLAERTRSFSARVLFSSGTRIYIYTRSLYLTENSFFQITSIIVATLPNTNILLSNESQRRVFRVQFCCASCGYMAFEGTARVHTRHQVCEKIRIRYIR